MVQNGDKRLIKVNGAKGRVKSNVQGELTGHGNYLGMKMKLEINDKF